MFLKVRGSTILFHVYSIISTYYYDSHSIGTQKCLITMIKIGSYVLRGIEFEVKNANAKTLEFQITF